MSYFSLALNLFLSLISHVLTHLTCFPLCSFLGKSGKCTAAVKAALGQCLVALLEVRMIQDEGKMTSFGVIGKASL